MTSDWRTSHQGNLIPASQYTMQAASRWLWLQQGIAMAARLTLQTWWCISTKTARHSSALRRPITQMVMSCLTIRWISSSSNSSLTAKGCTCRSNRPLALTHRHRRRSKTNQLWWCRIISAQWLRKCYNRDGKEAVVAHPANKNINSRCRSSRQQTRFLTICSATPRRYMLGMILLIARVVRASFKVPPIPTPCIRMSLQAAGTRTPSTPWSSGYVTSSLIRI